MDIKITPDFESPMPTNDKDVVPKDLHEAMRTSAETAKLLGSLGIPFELSKKDEDDARELIQATERSNRVPEKVYAAGVAGKLSMLLDEYDKQIITDSTQIRTYVTNKLLDISNCGDAKSELRALELLGKLSDVGAFTEKTEITIHAKTTIEIEYAIKDKIKRLLGAKGLKEVQDAEDITESEDELALISHKVAPTIIASEIEELPPLHTILPTPQQNTRSHSQINHQNQENQTTDD
jgi:hypothetical protein